MFCVLPPLLHLHVINSHLVADARRPCLEPSQVIIRISLRLD